MFRNIKPRSLYHCLLLKWPTRYRNVTGCQRWRQEARGHKYTTQTLHKPAKPANPAASLNHWNTARRHVFLEPSNLTKEEASARRMGPLRPPLLIQRRGPKRPFTACWRLLLRQNLVLKSQDSQIRPRQNLRPRLRVNQEVVQMFPRGIDGSLISHEEATPCEIWDVLGAATRARHGHGRGFDGLSTARAVNSTAVEVLKKSSTARDGPRHGRDSSTVHSQRYSHFSNHPHQFDISVGVPIRCQNPHKMQAYAGFSPTSCGERKSDVHQGRPSGSANAE
ncbi:hypothetical protein DFH06DRAFT_1150861 [Mycena polygramma]|nr:hypothetical protein DFH06DRAFT_1150861 [Mycena polygramma]